MKDIILLLSYKYKGNQYEIYKNLKKGIQLDKKQIKEIKDGLNKKDINFISIIDESFPKEFYEMKECLFGFFYKGNYKLMQNNSKFYIINEIWDEYTSKIIKNSLNQLVQNSVLITNNYKKTENQFIKLFRTLGGKIIHIAKEGLDTFDFSEINLENELVISQYPLNTHPKIDFFKYSNYVSATLSKTLISFSMKNNSKANHLINSFLNIGKDIYCFPGNGIDNENNKLIESGANMILGVSKVINI
ncbi:DNA processing protein [Mycoplasmopsis felis]|uniref:Smf/DprA SLOG domain-containing protein n=2 Tax=Mycoplasmopsis felis TaxID=33923 RepID=A0A809S8M3_9BACT|nr:DNA processing protein [Mycoplasmopsis felis]MCU9938396.1 DNA processing protein [Mycoplasmopsis felis]UWV84682.1 DNA processing protein [Mycoplasmopsis felis]WAM00850.1 DNA processing protein [Mycoplasmopsis felis]WQQ01858.1 DNA processing protein [Mycoplasmopsis felis]WQQ03625.1 DNA processing protein [Mycoplasmopsis felis]